MKKFTENKWFGLFVAGAITLVVFACFLFSTLVLWGMGRLAGLRVEYWVIIEALATAFATAAVIGVGYFAYKELEETAKTRYIGVADSLFQELNSPEQIAARRWIYNNLEGDPEKILESLSQANKDKIKIVLNSLDRLAFLTQKGFIDEDVIMPWMNPMVVKIWDRLEGYVKYIRCKRDEADYYLDAEVLAQRCRAWRAEKLGTDEIRWVEKKTDM
jgi:hypothetical protein